MRRYDPICIGIYSNSDAVSGVPRNAPNRHDWRHRRNRGNSLKSQLDMVKSPVVAGSESVNAREGAADRRGRASPFDPPQ